MKRFALLLLTAPVFAGPYIGMEREMKANENTPYVGYETGIRVEALDGLMDEIGTLSVQFDLNTDDHESRVKNLNVDGDIAVSDNLSVYTENDLDSDMNHVESMIGIKYSF